MKRPRILFIESLYLDQTPESGVTNAEHYLWNTYALYGGEYDIFSYDVTPSDEECLSKINSFEPDIVFLDYHLGSDKNPSEELLSKIKVPVVAIWWDHVWKFHIDEAERLDKYITRHVVVDAGAFYPHVLHPEKYLYLWTPQDPGLYYRGEPKINIGYYGRVNKADRNKTVDKIRELIPEIKLAGGRREDPLTKEEYAERFRETRMVVNFSKSKSGFSQMVGRTMEVLQSGALLLEQKGNETSSMFIPGEEYVEWETPEELLRLYKYYLEHENKRKKIALRGYAKARKYYNSDIWWNRVTNGL